MIDDARQVAEILLDLGAVSISPKKPFTWASGLRSPLYCDNRLAISTVAERRTIRDAFLRLIDAMGWRPELIAGTATAGIPHAAWIAESLSLPMVYVRSSAKGHGKQNLIEGRLAENAEVVVIEDLVSTGGSSVKAAQALQEAGARVLGVAAIFQYGMDAAHDRFRQAGIAYATLSNLSALLTVAVDRGALTVEEQDLVEQWRTNPRAWSETHAMN